MTLSFRPFLVRATVFGLVLSLAAGLLPAVARAAVSPEQFVQANVEKGLGILGNKTLSDDQRRSQFREFILNLADIRRTATFTLGAARRSATPAQIDAFAEVFKNYAITVYETRLSGFSGQTLKVKGATTRAAGDYVVQTELVDPKASSDKQPIEVDFRIVNEGGQLKVIDVGVVGVWLAIEERDQFTSFLQQHNDNLPALTEHLKALTEDLRKNPQAASGKPGR